LVVSRWRSTLIASWLAQICSTVGFGMAIPFLPPFIRELGIKDESAVLVWAGWLSTAAGFVMAITAPMWGSLADRYGRKLMVMRSMFGSVLVIGAMAYVQDVHQLLALRMLQGLLSGTVAASVALVSSVVPTRRAGFALGLMHTATYIGHSFGPFIGGLMAYNYGLRLPFSGAAIALLVGGVLTAVFVHEDFDPDEMANGNGEACTLVQMVRLRGFVTMAGLLFGVMFAGSFVAPILPLYIEQLSGGDPAGATKLTGYIMGLSGVAAAISATILGRMGDRLGYGRVLGACTLLTGLTLLPQAFVQTPMQLLICRLLSSFAGAGTIPATNALIRHIVPRHACGKAFGLTQTLSCLGWGIGPLVGGTLAAHFGMATSFFVVGLWFVGISGVVMWKMPALMLHIDQLRAMAEDAERSAQAKEVACEQQAST
jgi:DHA1 family multidrug resistance protein-like MFS transporter